MHNHFPNPNDGSTANDVRTKLERPINAIAGASIAVGLRCTTYTRNYPKTRVCKAAASATTHETQF